MLRSFCVPIVLVLRWEYVERMTPPSQAQNQPSGAMVKALREGAELTLSDLANNAEVHASHLSRVEAGAKGIGPERLHRIAAAIAHKIGAPK